MRKYLFSGLIGIILVVIMACGGDDPTSAPVVAPTVAAAPATSAPVATTAPSSGQTPASSGLADIAAKLAGGPGAIYVGDLSQLVGPAPVEDLGDFDGNVPLASLERQKWLFESDYYRSLIEAANFTNPTELVSSGEDITIQHACINRALQPCSLILNFWGPNVLARTNGQVTLEVSSFPELGLAGPDTLSLVSDGTIAMANIYTGYVAGELPEIEVQSLWGIYPDLQTMFSSLTSMHPELEKMVLDETGGVVLNHNWFAGNDQFFFSKKPLRTLDDFDGLKTRSHSAALSDWIEGMGAEAQFVAFSEVYTALERGILEAGVTGADPGFGQRWYEVTEYLNGPLKSILSTNNVLNNTVWSAIPADLQQILLEEGAKSELEQMRLAAIQIEVGTEKNIRAGMELIEFSPELADHSLNVAVMQHVVPGWLRRLGYTEGPVIDLFNEKVGKLVGVRIDPDGSVAKIGAPPSAKPSVSAALQAYADAHAGGPGAIYVGDINQMVGPAPTQEQGDADGNVPLGPLLEHVWVYESEYYLNLLDKANLDNPTQLTTSGESIEIQHACINRALPWCKLAGTFFFPGVLERTNGQLEMVESSYPELGIAGPDTLQLIGDGTLSMVNLVGPYVAGDVPALEIQYLLGIFPDLTTMYYSNTAMHPALEQLWSDSTDGGKVINFNWHNGDDIFFFSKKALRDPSDFEGLKVRAFGTAIGDWIAGMGAEPQFVAFAEVYTALERGILDAGVTGATPGFGQRWYEVTEYINGPLTNWATSVNVINKDVWDNLPADFQQIVIEEGAKMELEALRLASIQNALGTQNNIDAGLEYVEFSEELRIQSNATIIDRMVPNWVDRIGGGDAPVIKIFNDELGPRVGMRIEPDGSVVKAPVTKIK
jgi:TRAP-type C4-dicarboxylate transport system substrate-binding protein